MKKNLRLVSNRLSIILLLSIVFLSIPQQEFSSKYRLLVACSESVTATYPELNFSTYLGGDGGAEHGRGITTANNGSYYVTGQTSSNDFPTMNAYNSTFSGNLDAIIAKFSGNGSLLWSTFFGGSDVEGGEDIAVTGDGSCYITGFTSSSDFPTRCAYSTTLSEWGDAFVTKFVANGSLLWSTFLGGDGGDRGYDIVVTNEGSCYITGETASTDFPTKNTTIDSLKSESYDVFVTKFSSEGFLLWSTYLDGSQTDKGYGVAATDDGSCYVVGTTHSPDFPTNNAFDSSMGATGDAFITIFSNTPTFNGIPPPCTPQHTPQYTGIEFLIVIAVMPATAFILVSVVILYKKRK